MPAFQVDGTTFHYVDIGSGVPFVFLHGLGASVCQPTSLFRPPTGVRLLSFDARGHGETAPSGDPELLTFDTFGDDLIALLDHLGLAQAIVGGISMGAGVALNVAMRYPERLTGLVLSQPAWLDGPMPPRAVVLFDMLARLIRAHGARALSHLERDVSFLTLAAPYPETAAALRRQISEPRAVDAVARLERLPREAPIADLRDCLDIDVPALVLAQRRDPLHAYEVAVALARAIPDARLVQLTPPPVDPRRHGAEVQSALETFLTFARHRRRRLALAA